MKNNRFVSLLSLFVIAICASAAGQSDNLIVPGQRIGPVRLGMTPAELYRAMGDPVGTIPYRNDSTRYDFPGLWVLVMNGRVRDVHAVSQKYSTADGVHVGDSELAMQAKLGPPVKKTLLDPLEPQTMRATGKIEANYWYARGRTLEIRVDPSRGVIIMIGVWPPGL